MKTHSNSWFRQNKLVASEYDVGLIFLERSEFGSNSEIDVIINAFTIKINEDYNFYWNTSQWGHVKLPYAKAE